MLLKDLMWRMGGVMYWNLVLVDRNGFQVMDDHIDYVHMEHDECDQLVNQYGDWYVEDCSIKDLLTLDVFICPIEREED